jgi:integrase
MVEESFSPKSLKFNEWPQSHKIAWERAVKKGRIFEKDGPAAHRRERTNEMTREGYGIFLSYLKFKEIDIETLTPAQCLDRKNVKDFLDTIEITNNGHTIQMRAQQLYDSARFLEPNLDWSHLLNAYRHKRANVKPARDKSAHLRPLHELIDLGRELMNDALNALEKNKRKNTGMTPMQRALSYRDGLIIYLQSLLALRKSNLLNLSIGDTLIIRPSSMVVAFEADQMKQNRRFEVVLPQDCVKAIKIYIDVYRETLLHTSKKSKHITTNALWISRDGAVLKEGRFYDAICERTREQFGQSVWPHLFRDCKATYCMTEAPHLANEVKDMLGHNSIAVTEQHYSHAPMQVYSDRHADHLEELIRAAKRKRQQADY